MSDRRLESLGVPVPRCPIEPHTRWTIALPDGRFTVVERISTEAVVVSVGDEPVILFEPDCVSALCEAMTKCVQEIRSIV